MGRPRGSKNKKKLITFEEIQRNLNEKKTLKEELIREISDIDNQVVPLKTELKLKRRSLKKLEKEIIKLEAMKGEGAPKIIYDKEDYLKDLV